jgi:hypothetical protein
MPLGLFHIILIILGAKMSPTTLLVGKLGGVRGLKSNYSLFTVLRISYNLNSTTYKPLCVGTNRMPAQPWKLHARLRSLETLSVTLQLDNCGFVDGSPRESISLLPSLLQSIDSILCKGFILTIQCTCFAGSAFNNSYISIQNRFLVSRFSTFRFVDM